MNTKSLCRCAMFCALYAIGAYIKIPLPLCPVTLQVMFVVLAGLLLEKRQAVLCGVIYAAMGLLGLPVFAHGGGFGYALNPTFGYIVGFIFGGGVTAAVSKGSVSLKRMLLGAYSGMAVIYLIGTVYFYIICNYVSNSPTGIGAVLVSCVLLTLPADIVSCFFSAVLARKLRRHL